MLGHKSILCHIIATLDDAAGMLVAERDENTCREEFTPEEKAELGMRIEALERPKAEQRRKETQGRPPKTGDESSPVFKSVRTREKVAAAVGMSGQTYDKAKAVVESGDTEAIEEMDRTGKVTPTASQG